VAYEYKQKNSQFEIRNPHCVENVFLGISAGMCLFAGLAALIGGRFAVGLEEGATFVKCVVVGIGLLGASFFYAGKLLRQLRFFFGRGQPANLVPGLDADEQGYVAFVSRDRQFSDARALRETMRQNAVTRPVSRDAVDTLLYSLIKNLIYSPIETQRLVGSQFRNLLGLAFLTICFLVSLVGIRNEAAEAWVGLFYFVMTTLLVLRPLAAGFFRSARLPQSAVIIMTAVSLIGPVILAEVVPRTAFPFNNTVQFISLTFVILVISLSITILLFKAALENTVSPDNTTIAPYLETPSVNVTPAQMFTELAREMQKSWVEDIPNRTYMRILPDAGTGRDSFSAHLIEETQPLAQDIKPLTFRRSLTLPTTRWLTIVDFACAVLSIAGVSLLLHWALTAASVPSLIYGNAFLVIAAFGFNCANDFWSRFEFKSRLYWVECSGNFTHAKTAVGNKYDLVRTERAVTNVETMTLRVWVAEADSVTFGVDRPRDIISLRGLPKEAERICKHLAAFGLNQASVIAPSSEVDVARLNAINTLNAKGTFQTPVVKLSE